MGKFKKIVGGLLISSLALVSVSVPALAAKPAPAGTTVLVSNLQPSWIAPGGGGVYSAYYGPPDYNAVSPGTTAVFNGRGAAPIYAGITIDPKANVYEDQGLFGFKPGDVPVATFASQALTYDFVNQYGTAPVWVYIELNKGVTGDTMYQYVPTTNSGIWHTEDAGIGTHWQAWTDIYSGTPTGPMLSLAGIAAANPGKTVSRVYLTEGMGDSYHSKPNGTVAWVDKATIGSVTYDFVVTKDQCKNNGWKQFSNPSFKNQGQCIDWLQATAFGNLKMSNPSQKIEFNVNNNNDRSHDRDNRDKNTVEYWNYDYPGILHYKADVICTNVNPQTNEARFMFQIPTGHPGLSGLYVVAYVKEVNQKHSPDLYGHAATSDLSTATQWCQTGIGFSPAMYPITKGNVEIN